jgi:hypothetical protein
MTEQKIKANPYSIAMISPNFLCGEHTFMLFKGTHYKLQKDPRAASFCRLPRELVAASRVHAHTVIAENNQPITSAAGSTVVAQVYPVPRGALVQAMHLVTRACALLSPLRELA